MERILHRIIAAVFAAAILFTGFAPAEAEGESFDEFMTSEWIAMMESNYVSMHFSVQDYQSMGITKPEVSFGHVGYAYYEEDVRKSQESLDKLHSYDYSSLSDREKHDYLVYEEALTNSIAISQYADFIEEFNPYTGSIGDLPTMMTEFVFYTKEDIDDYLILAHDYRRYCDEMLEFTKEQAEKGYFMLDSVLDEEKEELTKFAEKKEDNPLIIIFENNIDAFEGLSESERASYKEKNREIVLNEILPEYEYLKTELEKLRGSRKVQDSVYNYPDPRGREYYAAVARYKTNSSDSMKQMFDYLTDSAKQSLNALIAILMQEDAKEEPDLVSGFNSPEEILDHLRNNLQNFPEAPDVNYTPSYLDPSITNPNVVAYYMVCPVDNISDNVIRINGDLADQDSSTLYTTLTHEGFPGHLYQFTWYFNTMPNPIRHDLSMMGYQEGWAQYVIRDLLYKSGLDATDAKMTFINDYFGYAANAAADIAVNGLGYDVEKLRKWMKEVGLDEEGAQELYDAVIKMPGEILPYGYGQMKFLEYRERMINSLGDDYDEAEFNRQLLENGPRPFQVVESDLEQYCKSMGRTFAKNFTFFESDEVGDAGAAGILSYLMMHPKVVIAVLIVIAVIVLVIVFLIVRAIVRFFTRKLE